MYHIEPTIPVHLQFPSMPGPVEVQVPWHVMRYLDRRCRRTIREDGRVVYEPVQHERTTGSVRQLVADDAAPREAPSYVRMAA